MYVYIVSRKDRVEALPSLPKEEKKNNPILVYISLVTPNTTHQSQKNPF